MEDMSRELSYIKRANPQLCENCRFYRQVEGYQFGQCRIRAKTIEGFPAVQKDEWCGEWQMSFLKKANEPA